MPRFADEPASPGAHEALESGDPPNLPTLPRGQRLSTTISLGTRSDRAWQWDFQQCVRGSGAPTLLCRHHANCLTHALPPKHAGPDAHYGAPTVTNASPCPWSSRVYEWPSKGDIPSHTPLNLDR